MSKAYSLDLRERVITAYLNEEGSMAELARRFRVGKNFVNKLIQRHRETGSIEPKPGRGKPPSKLNQQQQVTIKEQILKQNDIKLAELCEQTYVDTGIRVSQATMCRMIQKMDLPRKKRALSLVREIQKK